MCRTLCKAPQSHPPQTPWGQKAAEEKRQRALGPSRTVGRVCPLAVPIPWREKLRDHVCILISVGTASSCVLRLNGRGHGDETNQDSESPPWRTSPLLLDMGSWQCLLAPTAEILQETHESREDKARVEAFAVSENKPRGWVMGCFRNITVLGQKKGNHGKWLFGESKA